jgi:hypothetical protein
MHAQIQGSFPKTCGILGRVQPCFPFESMPSVLPDEHFHSQAGVKSEQSTTNFQVIFHHDFLQRTVAGRPLREMAFAVEVMAAMPRACKQALG